MATFDMQTSAPTVGARHYLDASVLLALAYRSAKSAGELAPPQEVRRGDKAAAFIARVNGSGGMAITTVIALEEIAAKVRNALRRAAWSKASYKSWSDFKQADPTTAHTADTHAHAVMIQMLAHTMNELGRVGAFVERREIPANETRKLAKDLRQAHLGFMKNYPSLDAMDALHIALGLEMGITSFLTFDQGWGIVPKISVFY